EGYYNFICELTDSQSKPYYFNNPTAYKEKILDELINMKFLKSKKYAEQIQINSIIDTYPIYHKRYRKDFGLVTKHVRHFSNKLHLLGRSGAFWYNNSDHSIRMSLDLSEKILGIKDEELDYRGYFG
ncbi:MAG: hypothetical protein KDK90_27330, partial [Leptospiraceae bacterium]|nr:hypothetical protein [Leptospiraceae bacterium]